MCLMIAYQLGWGDYSIAHVKEIYVFTIYITDKQKSIAFSLASQDCLWGGSCCVYEVCNWLYQRVVQQSSVYPSSILGRQSRATATALAPTRLVSLSLPRSLARSAATVFWVSLVWWGLCGASEIEPGAASAVLWPAVGALKTSGQKKRKERQKKRD